MYDSKMSSKASMLGNGSVLKAEESVLELQKWVVPKRIEDYELGDLVDKFLAKDSMVVDAEKPPKPRMEMVSHHKWNQELVGPKQGAARAGRKKATKYVPHKV